MLNKNDKRYSQGRKAEYEVAYRLRNYFRTAFKKSTYEEDTALDIDMWFGNSSVSIKTQHTAARTKNLSMELEVLNGTYNHAQPTIETEVYSTPYDVNGTVYWFSGLDWQPSWYHNGRSKFYAVLVSDTIYLIKRVDLKKWVLANGWDRITYLKADTIKSQIEIGHRHVNAKQGIVSLRQLLRDGVATELDV